MRLFPRPLRVFFQSEGFVLAMVMFLAHPCNVGQSLAVSPGVASDRHEKILTDTTRSAPAARRNPNHQPPSAERIGHLNASRLGIALPAACSVTSPAPTATPATTPSSPRMAESTSAPSPRTSRPCSRISTPTATESSTWKSSRPCSALTPSCAGRTRKAPSPSRPSPTRYSPR